MSMLYCVMQIQRSDRTSSTHSQRSLLICIFCRKSSLLKCLPIIYFSFAEFNGQHHLITFRLTLQTNFIINVKHQNASADEYVVLSITLYGYMLRLLCLGKVCFKDKNNWVSSVYDGSAMPNLSSRGQYCTVYLWSHKLFRFQNSFKLTSLPDIMLRLKCLVISNRSGIYCSSCLM